MVAAGGLPLAGFQETDERLCSWDVLPLRRCAFTGLDAVLDFRARRPALPRQTLY